MTDAAPIRAGVTILACAFFMSGCYSPDQKAFEREVQQLVQPGMELHLAVSKLKSHGLVCAGGPESLDCSRVEKGLVGCVERLSLRYSEVSVVDAVDINTIHCTGL
jgi:hypothetical protein